MRVAYLDCFAGVSGDMFLGALLDAGVDAQVLHRATEALQLGARLEISRVDRSGITATKVDVFEGDRLAEDAAKSHEESRDEQVARGTHQHLPKTQHQHKGGHHSHAHEAHSHGAESEGTAREEHRHSAEPHGEHGHAHGRSLRVIRKLIEEAELAAPVKEFALRTFSLLGHSEAKIHNVPVEEIHFHEVGAVDAIVDIVCAAAGIHALNERARAETGASVQWVCSAVNVGSGMVECAHGTFPVPAPATADLLRGVPTYAAHVQKELVTPTGAAVLRALEPQFGPQPAMRIFSIGYGAGTRNPAGFPNVLRLSLGDTELAGKAQETDAAVASRNVETIRVLETALDDMNPQLIAHVAELARGQGALDVMTSTVAMKKGRMATLVTVLAREVDAPRLEALLLQETSTLGVRSRVEQRTCLERSHTSVKTPYGEVRIKVGHLKGRELNAQPEFEDCRARAEALGVPLKRVVEAAISAYAETRPRDLTAAKVNDGSDLRSAS